MLYRTAIKRTFEVCSKLLFVPTKNWGVFIFCRDRRPRRSAITAYIFSTDRPGGRSLQVGTHFLVRQTTLSTWGRLQKVSKSVKNGGGNSKKSHFYKQISMCNLCLKIYSFISSQALLPFSFNEYGYSSCSVFQL